MDWIGTLRRSDITSVIHSHIEMPLLFPGENCTAVLNWLLVSILIPVQRLSLGNSRKRESLAPLQKFCSQTSAIRRGESNYSWYGSISWTSSGSFPAREVASTSLWCDCDLPAGQHTKHLTIMPISQNGGSMLFFQPGPSNRCSPTRAPPRSGFRRGPRFPFCGQGAAAPSWSIHVGLGRSP